MVRTRAVVCQTSRVKALGAQLLQVTVHFGGRGVEFVVIGIPQSKHGVVQLGELGLAVTQRPIARVRLGRKSAGKA
jgi:hypothetical protein